MVVAYFSAEIGLWSDLHTYSGGLGVLAGDDVKSAADGEAQISLLFPSSSIGKPSKELP